MSEDVRDTLSDVSGLQKALERLQGVPLSKTIDASTIALLQDELELCHGDAEDCRRTAERFAEAQKKSIKKIYYSLQASHIQSELLEIRRKASYHRNQLGLLLQTAGL